MQIETNRSLKNKQTKKTKKKRRWIGMLLSFFLFASIAAGAVWWKVEDFLDDITIEAEPGVIKEETTKPVNYNQDPISIVMIGKDSREGLGTMNTDVLIVAALNPKTKHVTMMSIPRDTGVQIPGYKGYHKINSVYAKGERERRLAEQTGKPVTETGTTLLKKTLEEALGIPIHYYAMVDFEGFTKVVDKLGGLEIDVEKSMKYTDPTDGTNINLEAGRQSLDGKQTLDYVRHRLDNRGPKYYSSDFDRGQRQQIVVKGMVDKMKSFTGISSFFSVLNVAGEHARTDLSKDQIRGLVMDFKSVGSENIASLDTGGYWDRASSHTIIPKENLKQIQYSFQHEMGIEGVKFESNLRVDGGSTKSTPIKKAEPAKTPTTPKNQAQEAPAKEPTNKPAEPVEPTEQPVPMDPPVQQDNPSGTVQPAQPQQPQQPEPSTPASPPSDSPAVVPAPAESPGMLQPPAPAPAPVPNPKPAEPQQPVEGAQG
ncbi:LCP family protein [Ammoniphilus sp. CFH 90114]|uniref:LCP family protein n=1 Tax=Ammoniphilus sp. CFH 90114 TaxID=2493665 RepID=UPI00100E564A|nr:LCP family protein [Ammoniphilus sp. CFH 90114]RXT05829.1 LytR family transcriptional regulator [Ammoniphilus sp. CFH 90114]